MDKTQDLKKWDLKVTVHCDGCARKVKKVLQNVDGVRRVTVDSTKQKVTVEGESKLSSDALIKKLTKIGKPAELWPEDQMQKPFNDDKKKAELSEKIVSVVDTEEKKMAEDVGKKQIEAAKKTEEDNGCSNSAASTFASSNGGDGYPEANGGGHLGDVRQNLSHPLPPVSVGTYPMWNSDLIHYMVQYHTVDPYAVRPYSRGGHSCYYQMPPPAYQPPPRLQFNADMFNDENTHSCTLM